MRPIPTFHFRSGTSGARSCFLARDLLKWLGMTSGFYPLDSLRGYAVLVVDANPETRALTSEILRYCGALVWAVASTEAALAAMREALPRVVVAGVRPALDSAAALLRLLRALPHEEGGKTPVIGVGPASGAAAARSSGFDGYLELPIDTWALCRLVGELIDEENSFA